MHRSGKELEGSRILILGGEFQGCEGVCLGRGEMPDCWFVSPEGSDEIIPLVFEKDFALLLDLSADPALN